MAAVKLEKKVKEVTAWARGTSGPLRMSVWRSWSREALRHRPPSLSVFSCEDLISVYLSELQSVPMRYLMRMSSSVVLSEWWGCVFFFFYSCPFHLPEKRERGECNWPRCTIKLLQRCAQVAEQLCGGGVAVETLLHSEPLYKYAHAHTHTRRHIMALKSCVTCFRLLFGIL